MAAATPRRSTLLGKRTRRRTRGLQSFIVGQGVRFQNNAALRFGIWIYLTVEDPTSPRPAAVLLATGNHFARTCAPMSGELFYTRPHRPQFLNTAHNPLVAKLLKKERGKEKRKKRRKKKKEKEEEEFHLFIWQAFRLPESKFIINSWKKF